MAGPNTAFLFGFVHKSVCFLHFGGQGGSLKENTNVAPLWFCLSNRNSE